MVVTGCCTNVQGLKKPGAASKSTTSDTTALPCHEYGTCLRAAAWLCYRLLDVLCPACKYAPGLLNVHALQMPYIR